MNEQELQQKITSLETIMEEMSERHQARTAQLTEEFQSRQDRLETRLRELMATTEYEAIQRMEQAERMAEASAERTEVYKKRAEVAEEEKRKALESVDGGPIHPDDPRVMHIWEKASRIATAGGFCAEYDRIAESLGIPSIEVDYEGSVTVSFSGSATIPISGRATRSDIADGEILHSEIDSHDVIQAIDAYDFSYDIEEVDVSPVE